MCNFFDSHMPPEDVEAALDAIANIPEGHRPRYNIRPTNSSYVVWNNDNGDREVNAFNFGLIPSWAKDRNMQYSTMNARDDKLMESRLWKPLFKNKRCIVPVNGFYEHHHFDTDLNVPGGPKPTDKVPYYFTLKSQDIFGFAGLYDQWTDKKTGEVVNTFSIITTEPNPLVRKIHNNKERMPTILRSEDYDFWLDESMKPEDYLGQNIFTAYPEDDMEAWQITKQLDYKKDDAQLIKPVDNPIDLGAAHSQQGGLF